MSYTMTPILLLKPGKIDVYYAFPFEYSVISCFTLVRRGQAGKNISVHIAIVLSRLGSSVVVALGICEEQLSLA